MKYFPIKPNNIAVNPIEWLISRNEGLATAGASFKYPTNYTTNGTSTPIVNGSSNFTSTITIGSYVVPADEQAVIRSFSISTTRQLNLYISFSMTKLYGSTKAGSGLYFMSSKNEPFQSSVSRYLKPNGNASVISFGALDDQGGNFVAAGMFEVESVTNDLDIDANKVIFLTSDSRGKGNFATVGTWNRDDLYIFQLKKYLWKTQDTVRVCNKSYAGRASDLVTYMIKNGDCDLPQIDLWIYDHGVNNVTAAGYGQSNIDAFSADIDEVIIKKQERYPNAKLILMGSTPLNNTTNESRLAVLRTIVNDKVTLARNNGDSTIYYLNLQNTFDGTILSNYYNNDGIHPTISNHTLIYNKIKDFIISNNITI